MFVLCMEFTSIGDWVIGPRLLNVIKLIFEKISVLSFHFQCLLICLCVCMFVTNLVPPYMGMAEEEEGKRGGGGWPCTRCRSLIAIFNFGIVMSFWGLIILAPPPPAIK